MKPTIKEMKEVSAKVNSAIDNREWDKAIDILLLNSEKHPEEYWPYMMLAHIYVELEQPEKALHYSSISIGMNSDDPLVAYNYAGILMYNNQLEKGIELMKEIVNDDLRYIAYGPYGEGLKYAKSLLMDSLASIGYAYLELGDKKNACKYFKQHLKKRQRGISSSFTKKQISDELKKCEG